jgi:DNA (cytosine-5)-methyltransferase 1
MPDERTCECLSLFSGIGGFDLGFEFAGCETVAQVEADGYCQTVLAHHWPEVPRYGDICEFDGRAYRGVDIITGGFPCQDLSLAGRRAGLSGARSGLFYEMLRVVAEARPRLLVWENVPGLLSEDSGNAMRTVCAELADIGYFGAWRMLDSQFYGVPQMRRRVFGAFALGGAGGWASGAAVLLEPEGGCWHPETGRKAREKVAYCLDGGAGGDSGKEQQRTFVPEVSYACAARDGKGVNQRGNQTTLVAHGPAYALRRDPGGIGQGHNTNYVADAAVRRLTPLECERLQGFPDGWTAVGGMSDTQRYKQIGNAVSVPVAYWIGLRAIAMLSEEADDAD